MTTPDPRAAAPTEPEAAAGPRQIIGWLGPLLAAHKGRTAVALLLLLTSKGATVATPLVLKQVVDALTPLQGGAPPAAVETAGSACTIECSSSRAGTMNNASDEKTRGT